MAVAEPIVTQTRNTEDFFNYIYGDDPPGYQIIVSINKQTNKTLSYSFPAAGGLRPWEQRAVVEMRLNVFETRGNEVLTCCEDCGKHFLISPTSIVTALVKRQTIDCSSCGPCGSLLPVWKRKKP
jgi:hypothetical protein